MPELLVKPDEVFDLVEQLEIENKIRIFEHLKPQILTIRWKTLFEKIDANLLAKPLSEAEIDVEVEDARKEFAIRRR